MSPMAASSSPFSSRHDIVVVNGWARHTGWLHPFVKRYAGDGVVPVAWAARTPLRTLVTGRPGYHAPDEIRTSPVT